MRKPALFSHTRTIKSLPLFKSLVSFGTFVNEEQFHRLSKNVFWHASMPLNVAMVTVLMRSRWSLQSFSWDVVRPGDLAQSFALVQDFSLFSYSALKEWRKHTLIVMLRSHFSFAISLRNHLDPDQARLNVGPDLGANLKKISSI